MNITGINLHEGQIRIKNEIVDDEITKFHILNASRQSGKTTLLEQLCLYYTLNNPKMSVLWVAPVYSITKKTFSNLVNNLIDSGIIQDFSRADQSITFTNKSRIEFKSAQNYDNIRGGSYNYVFIDEFAYIDPDAWNMVIRQTLTVVGIKTFISSTPKGKNLFYELAQRGMSVDFEQYKYHYMNYLENPYYDLDEVDDAKRTLPEKIFKQEYEAEFMEDGGSVFENISTSAVVERFSNPVRGERYYAGIDLGKQVDYTVLTIMDQNGKVVFIYRDNNKTWETIIQNLITYLNKYKPQAYLEVNSIGDPIFEQIKKHYPSLKPFITSSTSKKDLIENLIYGFSTLSIDIPSKKLFPELYNELERFSFEYNRKTRNISYSAPAGFHDDTVMSLAITYHSLTSKKPVKTYVL